MNDWLDHYYGERGVSWERSLDDYKQTEPDDYDPDEKHGLGVVGAHLAKLKAEKLATFFKVFNIRWR